MREKGQQCRPGRRVRLVLLCEIGRTYKSAKLKEITIAVYFCFQSSASIRAHIILNGGLYKTGTIPVWIPAIGSVDNGTHLIEGSVEMAVSLISLTVSTSQCLMAVLWLFAFT